MGSFPQQGQQQPTAAGVSVGLNLPGNEASLSYLHCSSTKACAEEIWFGNGTGREQGAGIPSAAARAGAAVQVVAPYEVLGALAAQLERSAAAAAEILERSFRGFLPVSCTVSGTCRRLWQCLGVAFPPRWNSCGGSQERCSVLGWKHRRRWLRSPGHKWIRFPVFSLLSLLPSSG